jgi:pyruvate dehydrogenase E1 component alpha subunit
MVCEEVHEAVEEGVQRARNGGGPSYIEAKTYRYKGHSISDPAKYRTRDELEAYREKDPIILVKKTIMQKKYTSRKKLDEIDETTKQRIQGAVEFAENSDYPSPEELYQDVYTQKDYPFIKD